MNWHNFWTNENNPSLPKSEYLYGSTHITFLIGVAILTIILAIIFYNKNEKIKRKLFICLGIIFLVFEILSRIVNLIIADSLTINEIATIILPMHICSVMVWVLIFAIFTNNQVLKNFATIGGLLATTVFLLYPAVGLNRTYMSFTCLYSTLTHCLGFCTAILLIILKQTNFNFKKIWQIYLCFIIMFAWGFILDYIIFPNADYMYLRNDPLELTLNFPYQILYAIILIVYVAIFYLVQFIIDRIKNKKKTVTITS